jgi:hypothetical protein
VTLGHQAVEAGYRVYYTTAADLVARTSRAAIKGRHQDRRDHAEQRALTGQYHQIADAPPAVGDDPGQPRQHLALAYAHARVSAPARIGMSVTRTAISIGVWCWPGNQSEELSHPLPRGRAPLAC